MGNFMMRLFILTVFSLLVMLVLLESQLPAQYIGGPIYDPAAAYPAIDQTIRDNTAYKEKQADMRQTQQIKAQQREQQQNVLIQQSEKQVEQNPGATPQNSMEWIQRNQPSGTPAVQVPEIYYKTLYGPNVDKNWPPALRIPAFAEDREQIRQAINSVEKEVKSGQLTKKAQDTISKSINNMYQTLRTVGSRLTSGDYAMAVDYLKQMEKKYITPSPETEQKKD
jgi:hypothetical protein